MDEKTIAAYDHYGTQYDEETADFWQRFPKTFFDRFLELAGPRVLDIGSGPGRDALALKEDGHDVTCLDASRAMIAMTEAKGLTSILGDFAALPFEDESFDAAWAYTSFLHVPKSSVDVPLSEARRVLTPSGILGLGMIEGDTELYRESSGMAAERWFSYYRKEELEELLGRHGFDVLYFETFTPSTKRYLNFIARKT